MGSLLDESPSINQSKQGQPNNGSACLRSPSRDRRDRRERSSMPAQLPIRLDDRGGANRARPVRSHGPRDAHRSLARGSIALRRDGQRQLHIQGRLHQRSQLSRRNIHRRIRRRLSKQRARARHENLLRRTRCERRIGGVLRSRRRRRWRHGRSDRSYSTRRLAGISEQSRGYDTGKW